MKHRLFTLHVVFTSLALTLLVLVVTQRTDGSLYLTGAISGKGPPPAQVHRAAPKKKEIKKRVIIRKAASSSSKAGSPRRTR